MSDTAVTTALPAARSTAVVVDRCLIARYAGAAGDFNPLHLDDGVARAAGFPSAFAPGMLIGGLLAHHVTAWFGPTTMRRLRMRFVGQVWPGDRIRITASPRSWKEDQLVVGLAACNEQGEVVASGAAVVYPIEAAHVLRGDADVDLTRASRIDSKEDRS